MAPAVSGNAPTALVDGCGDIVVLLREGHGCRARGEVGGIVRGEVLSVCPAVGWCASVLLSVPASRYSYLPFSYCPAPTTPTTPSRSSIMIVPIVPMDPTAMPRARARSAAQFFAFFGR